MARVGPPGQGTWPPADPYVQPPMSPAPIWEDPAAAAQSAPPMWEDQQPPKAYLRQQPEPPGPPGRRTRTIVITLLVILLCCARRPRRARRARQAAARGGRGAPSRGAPSRSATASQSQRIAPSQPTPHVTPTPARTTPRPSPSAGPPHGHATVAVASAAARDPAAASVASFLTSYFTAINAHDYQRFRSLLDQQMQQIETAQRFAAGFGSTTDSGAVLIGLSPTPGGPPRRDRRFHQPSVADRQPGPLSLHTLDDHALPQPAQALPDRRSARGLPGLTTALLTTRQPAG